MHKTQPHCYIGVTSNYAARTALHRHNIRHSSQKLYETMRANGGLDCYDFMVMEELDCDNRRDAERCELECIQRLERQNIELLNTNKIQMNDCKLRNTKMALTYYYKNREGVLKKMRDKRQCINTVLQINANEPQDNTKTVINTPL